MIKGSIQGEGITIINIYAPNVGAPQYIRQTLTDIKGEIDSNTIVGDFNTPLTPMDRSSKQKINKETQVLSDTLDEVDLFDIFFILRSILSDMNSATPALFCFPFAWNIFFHPLSFSLYVSLGLKWVSCRQHILGLVFVST